ncbi:MAG: ATP-dependent metallopeptidase FtsH/Yme1/Tma family protein, partial [Candidatus Doudnabacteria bacterium]|nr:ATP-dependent metallopeptidase FtsH/Yme1/Tma family protein [Candidatus Doudnabacteria bacterium]
MGKLVKNIILILIGFLIISGIFSMFSTDSKTKTIPISEVVNLVDQEKVESLKVTDGEVIVKLKGSDIKQSAKIGGNTNIYEILDRNGIAKEKIRNANIEEKPASGWSSIASAVLPFLIPFIFISLFIYFLMRQVQGSNNRALSFGQSSVRLNDERKNRVKFSDVAGSKEAKEELK